MKAKIAAEAAIAVIILSSLAIVFSSMPVLADSPDGLVMFEPDFVQIGDTGFGDPQNNYAWGMAMFKDDLYVGTGRNIPYTVFLQLKMAGVIPWDMTLDAITHPGGVPPPPYGPDMDPVTPGNQYTPDHAEVQVWADDMSAEIWRYHNGTWTKVHEAQTFINPINGYTYPEGTGYRFLVTYTDKNGEEALYAGVGLGYGRTLLLKSTDGTNWTKVNFIGAVPPYDTRAMAVHNGKLYVGLGSGGVFATDDPNPVTDTWVKVADFGDGVAIGALESSNGYLYATTWQNLMSSQAGFEVWRSTTADPGLGDWVQLVSGGAGDAWNPFGADIESFGGDIYVGSMALPITYTGGSAAIHIPKGFDLIRIDDHDRWDLIIGSYFVPEERETESTEMRDLPLSALPSGFGNPLNLYCWQLEEHEGLFYLTTFDAGSFLRVVTPELLDSLNLSETSLSSTSELGMGGIGGYEMLALSGVMEEIDPLESLHALGERFGGSDMWVSRDGVYWFPADLNGFDNPNNYGFRTLVSTDSGLYVGTANPFQGCQVWIGEVRPV